MKVFGESIFFMPAPHRIASLLPSATEILFSIGLGDRVVAVSHECDDPPEVIEKPKATFSNIDGSLSSRMIDTAVQENLQSGRPLYGIDVPLLKALQCDLIVTQSQCDVCAVNYDDVLAAVDRLGGSLSVPIIALSPQSLRDIFRDIVSVGLACGEQRAARSYTAKLRRRVEAVADQLRPLTEAERPRTVLIEWLDPLMLSGNWMPEVLALAGGRCPLLEVGDPSAYIRWEQIVAFDPEVVVICPCGFDLPRTCLEANELTSLPGWSSLMAVRNNRVFAVDGNAYFNRSGPRIVESLEILAHLLHPTRIDPAELKNSLPLPWCALSACA
jgi:iron complex transport system substrate-binding protein